MKIPKPGTGTTKRPIATRFVRAFQIDGITLGPYELRLEGFSTNWVQIKLIGFTSTPMPYQGAKKLNHLHPHACPLGMLDVSPDATLLASMAAYSPSEMLCAAEDLLRHYSPSDAYVRLKHWRKETQLGPASNPGRIAAKGDDKLVYVITTRMEPWDYEPTNEMWGVFANYEDAKATLLASNYPWKDEGGTGMHFHFEHKERPEASAQCAVPMQRGSAQIHRTLVQTEL